MATPQFHSGKLSGALVVQGGVSIPLAVTGWSVNPNMELASFKNAQTGTYEVLEPTWKSLSGSLSLDFDFANNPYLTAGGGLTVTNESSTGIHLQLLTNTTSGLAAAYWDLPAVFITGNPMSDASEGKPTVTINFRASGSWVEPAV